MRRPDVVTAAVIAAIFAAMTTAAFSYPSAARLLPLVVGLPALALSLWELRSQWANEEPMSETNRSPRGAAAAFAWLILFVSILIGGGLVIGGVVAVTMAQHFWLKESWRTALAGGSVAFVVLFAGIERGLGQQLFEGLLMEWARAWLGI